MPKKKLLLANQNLSDSDSDKKSKSMTGTGAGYESSTPNDYTPSGSKGKVNIMPPKGPKLSKQNLYMEKKMSRRQSRVGNVLRMDKRKSKRMSDREKMF